MNIRKATIEDSELILDLVKKLATYERKKPEDIKLTLAKIKSHGFGSNKYFDTLIAEYNHIPVGYAIYFFTYSACSGAPAIYMEDLYVDNEYRRKGIATALFDKLAEIAREKHCCRIDWHALDWNEEAIEFYQTLGAEIRPDLVKFRFSLGVTATTKG